MKPMTLLAVAVSVMALGAGCFETTSSNNVKPDAIYQSYQASYSESDSSMRVTAEFNVGGSAGTTLELASPSRVTFDGTDLRKESFLGTRYSSTWVQRFDSNHSFEW